MKSYKRILSILSIGLLTSCDGLFEDVNVNPNLPSNASPDLILTGLQVGSVVLHEGNLARSGGLWSGYFNGLDRQYFGFYNYIVLNNDFNSEWSNVYTNVFRNTVELQKRLDELNQEGIIAGINKIMASHTMGMATALWGDMPYSDAGNFVERTNPSYDSQEAIYEAIQIKLDEAIEDLTSPVGRPIQNADIFFNGDPASWTKVAYSLKARFYLHAGDYQKAYDNALLGIRRVSEAWMAPHFSENDSQNLYFQFYNGNRGDDLSSDGTYFLSMIQPNSAAYKGNAKTDERGRFRHLLHERSENSYVPNTSTHGAFHAMASYPFFSYEENTMILAETALKTQGVDEGLVFLNELREYFNTGAHISSQYRSEGVSYQSYDLDDFRPGGMAHSEGLDMEESLLKEIYREKYVSLFGQLETYNDVRRTFAESARLDVEPNVGNQFPQRFLYPQTELDRNINVPTHIPDIFTKTPINNR